MKKLLATILALVMALGVTTMAWATGEETGEAKPVEYWTGFDTADKTDKAFDALDEAITYAKGQTDAVRRVVVAGDYTLSTNVTIQDGIYVDVLGKMTVSDGATVTVSATAKRLGVWNGGTLINNGTILVCGTSATAGKVMVQDGGTFDINTLRVPEGYVLDKNRSNYFATEESKALFKVVYKDGTEIKTADISNKTKAKSVTLLGDVSDFAGSFDSTDKLAEDFVLDLGGFTLSGKSTASTQVLTISVPMTIQNGTVKYISNNGDYGAVKTSADVTIANNATIDGGVGYGIWTSGYGHTLTVNGTVKSDGAYAITGNGNDDTGYIDDCNITVNDGATIQSPNGIAIYHPEMGTVTVNGGDISGHTGIEMCAGKLVVKGGSITSSGANMDATGSQNAILDGGAISIIDRNYPGGTPTMEITGGTIRATGEGALAVKAYDYKSDMVKAWTNAAESVKVSGGTFSSDPRAYVGAQPVATAAGDYIVGGKDIADAANSGKEVTITKGGAIDGVDSGKSIKVGEGVEGVTINNVAVGAGKTYTVPVRYYYYNPSSTDTKKDEGKTSPKTFDAGVGIYAVTAVLSVTGMAWTAKKRH